MRWEWERALELAMDLVQGLLLALASLAVIALLTAAAVGLLHLAEVMVS